MAVFVDLEDENEPPETQTGNARPTWDARDPNAHAHAGLRNRELRGMEGKVVVAREEERKGEDEDARPNPNRNIITQALGCYP
jgi:hypothetical protein